MTVARDIVNKCNTCEEMLQILSLVNGHLSLVIFPSPLLSYSPLPQPIRKI